MTRESKFSTGAEGNDAGVPLHVLARAAQRGRRKARDRFARRLQAVVEVVVRRRLAAKFLREADVEDVVQDVLLKIVTELPGFEVRSEASLHQWINTLVTHVIRNRRDHERAEMRDPTRRRSLRELPADETEDDPPPSARDAEPSSALLAQDPPLPEIVSDRELYERAIAALRQLAPDEVYAVRRIELEGETIAAVARELGLGESTIRQRLVRALARIGQRLGEEFCERFGGNDSA